MKRLVIILALAATVALPFLLRPRQIEAGKADVTLSIITPHNESIRHEFARGFKEWYRARTGRTVAVDWRVIGGTAEITRFLEGEYTAAFRNYWTGQLGKPWTSEVEGGFQADPASTAPEIMREARAAFLASSTGCGLDLFFGGGPYDFIKQATAGRLVDSGMLQQHPEWFGPGVIPQVFAGETYWDKGGRWIGTVLSSYGIVYNRDSLQRLGVEHEPRQWSDLTDPRYLGEVALADPTKSSSIAKAFENVIQQQMQRRLATLQAARPAADGKQQEAQAVREGWIEGLRLMQLISANARYFTDSSQKPPIDVASGNCAAGICIDFYGRQQEEAVRRRANSNRLGYSSPVGGTVSSVDPIALLRGAPNREVAIAFIEYVLSLEGQRLWAFKPGVPGGPERYALRRLPVRRDFYAQREWSSLRNDPEAEPFSQQDQLIYRGEWTGGLFRELAFIIRVMGQDTHPELVQAWRAINAAPEPARSQALAALQDLSAVDYDQARGDIKRALGSKNKVDEIRLANQLGTVFRGNYARALALARQ